MKFTAITSLAVMAGAALAAPAPEAHPAAALTNVTLAAWLENAVNGFFPNHTGWDAAFDASFAPGLNARFNDGAYNFTTLRAYFGAIEANLAATFDAGSFAHGFTGVVASVWANGTGGDAMVTGTEGGTVNGTAVYGTDGAYAVVQLQKGALKIVEWRELTNLA